LLEVTKKLLFFLNFDSIIALEDLIASEKLDSLSSKNFVKYDSLFYINTFGKHQFVEYLNVQ